LTSRGGRDTLECTQRLQRKQDYEHRCVILAGTEIAHGGIEEHSECTAQAGLDRIDKWMRRRLIAWGASRSAGLL
jgi:hypothetical protein